MISETGDLNGVAKRRLLLADDSVTIQKVVNLTFADEGIEVAAVGDGDAAMKKFVEAVPDLVMVDVNMPGLDGYRICEMIKQDAETRHIPVILLVGSFEPFDEAEARRVGADDFLTKPFQSIRQLVGKVSDLLGGESDEEKDFPPPLENAAENDSTAKSISDEKKVAPIEHDAGAGDSEDAARAARDSAARFSDAALDDEMIQTARLETVPAEKEIVEYESEPIDDSQTFEDSSADETFAEADDSSDASGDFVAEPKPAGAPPAKDEIKEIFAAAAAVPQEAATEKKVAPPEFLEKTADGEMLKRASPEWVEAVADRVVEKIAARFVERIVREVIAQMDEKK